jgi:hypothetical protein
MMIFLLVAVVVVVVMVVDIWVYVCRNYELIIMIDKPTMVNMGRR